MTETGTALPSCPTATDHEFQPGGPICHRQGDPIRPPSAVPPLEHEPLRGRIVPERLRLYALCAPPLDGGVGERPTVEEIAGRKILTAEKDGIWLALAATVPFRACPAAT